MNTILKFSARNHMLLATLSGNTETFEKIAEFNGGLRPAQVRSLLLEGETVYTNLSYFRMDNSKRN